MFSPDQYELLDFGHGRKLEQVGPYLLDRMSPPAEQHDKQNKALWGKSTAQYQRTSKQSGEWKPENGLPKAWTISHNQVTFEIKPTQFGHLGIFPEQAKNWDWIDQQVSSSKQKFKVLNLFAYTGGSTLAAAAAGAEVTHVDSAKSVVTWARRNAELSKLQDAPIRWITEDALKFVSREVKRGNQYDAVILDPPTYGHGAGKQVWKLSERIDELLSLLSALTAKSPRFLLFTCHSPGYGTKELEELIAQHFDFSATTKVESHPLYLQTRRGRKLSSGVSCRYLDFTK